MQGRDRLSRRTVLAGLAAGLAAPALARPPEASLRPVPRPAELASATSKALRAPPAAGLVREARLGGGTVAYAVADAQTGEMLESMNPHAGQPPASVAKAATALYALDTLGPGHRFRTRVLAAGPVTDGRLDGDLILAGSGDPVLQTDDLAALAARLKETGLREVTGRFLVYGGALPRVEQIDPGQPVHVGYNPAVSGLNLNFNRVHFEWARAGGDYDVTMDARSARYRPAVEVARMRVVGRDAPLYTYADEGDVDSWTVARWALGGGGARWLPVREPALYAGEVFQTFARSNGIALDPPRRIDALPADTRQLAHVASEDLREIVRGMLRYSTNITAEALGLAASVARGVPPRDLAASASRMSDWVAHGIGSPRPDFVDHSGLGDRSRVTPADMVQALVRLGPAAGLEGLMKDIPVRDADYRVVQGHPARVAAKTGTLNFVSGLGGYVTVGGRKLAFATFAADTERRAGIPRAQRDRPEGARGWARRARVLQMRLIDRWSRLYA